MPLTKEIIVKRIEELKLSLEQVKTQAAAIQGALADAEWVLSQFDEQSKKDKK